MGFYYAQINDKGIVSGVSMLADEIFDDRMVPLAEEDLTIVGKKYENGVFVDVPVEPHVPTYEEEKARYLSLIRDAKDLGEDAEVDRLKLEWYNLKAEKGWLQEGEQPPTTTVSTEELSTVIDTMLGETGGE